MADRTSPDALTELPASPLGRLRSTGNTATAGGGVACASCAVIDAEPSVLLAIGAFAARADAAYPLPARTGCVPCAAAAAKPPVAGGFGAWPALLRLLSAGAGLSGAAAAKLDRRGLAAGTSAAALLEDAFGAAAAGVGFS